MPDLHVTKHAEMRMRQRGYRNVDLDLVLSAATDLGEDAFLLTDRDVAREIERRKQEIQQLERLRGSRFIMRGGALVTIYHAVGKQKRAMAYEGRGA